MKNLKSREDFLSETKGLTLESLQPEINALNERAMVVKVDAEDTKAAEASIKKVGARVTKSLGFGVLEIEADPKLVGELKYIEDVTSVEEIKKK